jgi:hypothetical protein
MALRISIRAEHPVRVLAPGMLSSLENLSSVSPVPFDFPVLFASRLDPSSSRRLSLDLRVFKLSPLTPKIRPGVLVSSEPILAGECPMGDRSGGSEVTGPDASSISLRYDEVGSNPGFRLIVEKCCNEKAMEAAAAWGAPIYSKQ